MTDAPAPGAESSGAAPTPGRLPREELLPAVPAEPADRAAGGGTTLTARADVATAVPARYGKQLVEHLGRRTAWTTDGATSTAGFGEGTGSVVVGDGVLTLLAEAADEAGLQRVQDVLGRHLVRFGTRAELTVVWTRTGPG